MAYQGLGLFYNVCIKTLQLETHHTILVDMALGVLPTAVGVELSPVKSRTVCDKYRAKATTAGIPLHQVMISGGTEKV